MFYGPRRRRKKRVWRVTGRYGTDLIYITVNERLIAESGDEAVDTVHARIRVEHPYFPAAARWLEGPWVQLEKSILGGKR